MNFLIDFILLAIVVIYAVTGFKKGFVKTIISNVKNVVAFIVASSFSAKLGAWLKDRFFMDLARDMIKEKISGFIGEKTATNADISNLLNSEHSGFLTFIEKMGGDTDEIIEMVSTSEEVMTDRVSEYIAEPCVTSISSVVAFILLFVSTLLVLLIVGAILNLIVKIPVLKGTNKILGGILGVVMGIFWAFVITALIRLVVPYFSDNAIISSLENGGPVYGFINSLAPKFLSVIL